MDIRKFFFKCRGFTPIPLVIVVVIFARPTLISLLWGILLMLAGELIRIYGVAYAGGATRTRKVGAPGLVTNGPFSRVRNPLYMGNIFMYSGAAIIANVWQPWLVFLVWIFFGIQYYFIIDLEEEKLQKIFGETYITYCKNVNRFIPGLKAYSSGNITDPDYKMALKSEKSTFLSFISVLILLIGKMLIFNR